MKSYISLLTAKVTVWLGVCASEPARMLIKPHYSSVLEGVAALCKYSRNLCKCLALESLSADPESAEQRFIPVMLLQHFM